MSPAHDDPLRGITMDASGRPTQVSAEPGEVILITAVREDGQAVEAQVVVGGIWEKFFLPASCVACQSSFGTEIALTPEVAEVDAAGPWPCPNCGAPCRVTDPLTIQDGAGRNVTLRRLDLLRKVALGVASVKADPVALELLTQLVQDATAGVLTSVELAARLSNSPDQAVRSLADLLPRTRADYIAYLGLLVAVLTFFRPSGTPAPPTVRVVVEQVVDQGHPALDASTDPAAPRRAPGRNEPCWCESGLKYKRCHIR